MLRNLQMELTYGTITKEAVPEIFYNKPALLNEDDFAAIIEENRRKQHSLKVDRELRILQSLYHDLENQLKKEQQCNQQLEQKLKQANVNTGKVRNSYKKTINQYKSVLANHDLKLWQFLKIYVEYRFIQVKNLFKQDKNKKRPQQKIKEHDSISTEDLQRLKDKFEN